MMTREAVGGGEGPRRWWIVREVNSILGAELVEVSASEEGWEDGGGAWCEWSKQCVVVGTTAGSSLASSRME